MQQPNPISSMLRQIWPTVYRIINGGFFTGLRYLKNAIKLAIRQMKGEF